jgi:methylenetetrahydrofolate reductase (NADPH)
VTTPIQAKSQLSESLRAGRLTLSAEFLPSRGADASAVRQLAASIPRGITAVMVSESHEDVRACALSSAALLVREKLEPILPLVVRDRNRIALQSDVLGAAALGVINVLCVSGDHQSLGVCPQAAGAFDLDPLQLLQALKAMRDEGVLLAGERVAPAPSLFLAAVAHPTLRPLPLNLLQTRKKIAAGAQALFTQPLWDLAGFVEWMTAVRDAGLHERAYMIASVRPLASAEEATALQKRHPSAGIPDGMIDRLRKASHPEQEGIALCAEIAAKAKEVAGVRGIHIQSSARQEALTPILQKAGLASA